MNPQTARFELASFAGLALPALWCAARDLNPQDLRIKNPLLCQLSYRRMERMRRIELLSGAWKAPVLPLNDIRIVAPDAIESSPCRFSGDRSPV